MPKEGFESITVPTQLSQRVSAFIEESGGLTPTKAKAISQAWSYFETSAMRMKNPAPVRIGNDLVGHNQPVYVIAEIGINHNGDVDLAKKLIDLAVDAGCQAVKFQKRTVDVVYSKEELAKPRENPFGPINGDLKRGLEFGEAQYAEIDRYCKDKGITWFASPWDEGSVKFLEKFQVPCYKVASASLTDKGLLEKIRATGKPVILSTGMSDLDEIKDAIDVIGIDNLILMHCTSTYPTAPEEQNLKIIPWMRRHFDCPIGYSGHEPGVYATLYAMALGACAVERHITLDRTLWGSDQAASLEPKGLKIICDNARLLPTYMGDGRKKVYESEVPIREKLRRVDSF